MDTQQINRIVEEVLARLGQAGSSGGASTAGNGATPPGGNGVASTGGDGAISTGGNGAAAPAPASPAPAAAAAAAPSGNGGSAATPPTTARVFVTADMLDQRLKAGSQGVVELAHHERLTPNAQDLVDLKHLTVRTAPEPVFSNGSACSDGTACSTAGGEALPAAPASSAAGANPAAPTGGIGLVTERPDTKVESLLGGLSRDGLSMVSFNRTDCWMENLQALGAAIAAGSVDAGVAVLPHAADAVLLAGKLAGVRPVQGTRPDSVAAAVRHFGANLLILEHAFSTFHEMRMMVRGFAGARPAPTNQPLLDAVAELERRR